MLAPSDDLNVQLNREYAAEASVLFSAIANGTVFRLTGAKHVSMAFHEGGQYHLDFGTRNGKHCYIEGHFTRIVPDEEVVLIWNVDGFRDVPDVETAVTFTITALRNSSKLDLKHDGIKTRESADGKWQGWKEVLEGLDEYVTALRD